MKKECENIRVVPAPNQISAGYATLTSKQDLHCTAVVWAQPRH